jgi:hypothetical protein
MTFPKPEIGLSRAPAEASIGGKFGYCQPIRKRNLIINALGILMRRRDSDYKSPYAYLAFDPGFALEEKYRVRVRWVPFQLRLKGKGERSVYSEYKVKYELDPENETGG